MLCRQFVIFIASGFLALAAGCSTSGIRVEADHKLQVPEKLPFRFRIVETRLTIIIRNGKHTVEGEHFVGKALSRLPERYPQYFTDSKEKSIPIQVDWTMIPGAFQLSPYISSLITLGLGPRKRKGEIIHQIHLKTSSAETNAQFTINSLTNDILDFSGALLQTYKWSGLPSDYVRYRNGEHFFESDRLDPFILDAFASFDRDALIELYNSKYVKPTELLE